MTPLEPFSIRDAEFHFRWDWLVDRAELSRAGSKAKVWSGSLLPLLYVQLATGETKAVKATVTDPSRAQLSPDSAEVALTWETLGAGQITLSWGPGYMKVKRLEITWTTPVPPALIALYFGNSVLTADQRATAPSLDRPFWPDWRSEGFGIASAKTNPMQSFFRSWDFGHANLPLGSFGPAMGTPYAAAFPRPTYAGCMGGQAGWICLGAGEIPDAALTFQVRSRSGGLEWLYREDLWGAPAGPTRTWENPLWLTWNETAWQAYRDYFRLFPASTPKLSSHQRSFSGTWGDFRQNRFDLHGAVDRAIDGMKADILCIDDPWESSKGSGAPDLHRLPNFSADLAYARSRGLGVGLWAPVAWVADYEAHDLTPDDLLLSRDGVPVRSNWAVDPREESPGLYCLDPGSPGARRFLHERTRRMIRDFRPSLLKIDFGYGLPGPDACTSRHPQTRGERLAWTYADIIAQAARSMDPTITLLYYSLHPLWDLVQDQCSLDDLGDAGEHEATGHGQWSIWAALAADRGLPLMGSSGYLWTADTDVLLNTAVLGAPGANLPASLAGGAALPEIPVARRKALFRWFRRNPAWTPLWLDSTQGDLRHEPLVKNWGRLETIHATPTLTSLALREPSELALHAPELRGLAWTGRWAVIALAEASIFSAASVALIPFDGGTLFLPRDRAPGKVTVVRIAGETNDAHWTWRLGRVELSAPSDLPGNPLLGVIVSDVAG